MAEDFQVYAIRFAHRDASVRGEHFYGHDPCALDAWPISYYVGLPRRARRRRVHAGNVVLAADASHFCENVEQEKPYGVLPSMYDAFDTLHALASGPELIVPGHDPQVLQRFPAVPGLEGLAVRIA
ncbi:hypothetical protein [Saccharopolyspora sp. NPDC050642]|uniref:hypothetical protein n=1 Tax=Saccharopolyspora sp. NPDC050642 TaxID=3157099 RepID=UPI00340FDE55